MDHPVPTPLGDVVELFDGTSIEHVEHTEQPYGAATRQLFEVSMDDPDFNLAAFMKNAAEAGYQVQYSVNPEEGRTVDDAAREVNQQIAQEMLKNRDYENFQMMQRSRKVFDTAHHSMTLEILSKSGQSVKQSVTTSFPLLTGGYDQWREEQQHGDKTDIHYFLNHKKRVMTKPEHLPSIAEVRRCSEEQHRILEEKMGPDPTDLPNELRTYPRPMCASPPEHGTDAVLMLQSDLDTPVAIEEKQLYRIRILGLAGTGGQTHKTAVFTGRELREHMTKTFLRRKKYLAGLQSMADKKAPGARIDIDHCPELVCGAAMNCITEEMTAENLSNGRALLANVHFAWSGSDPKTRKLMMTGFVTGHLFSRPPRAEVEVETEVCACCLEDIAGEAWSCAACHKCMHDDCFGGWAQMCRGKHIPVTCPNCRAEVA